VTSAAIAQPRRVVANMVAKGTAFAVEKGAQLALVVVAGWTLGEAGFGRFAWATNLAVLLAFATAAVPWFTALHLPRLPPSTDGRSVRRATPGNGALGGISVPSSLGEKGINSLGVETTEAPVRGEPPSGSLFAVSRVALEREPPPTHGPG